MCTPRYIRLKAMSTASTMHTTRSTTLPVHRAMPPYSDTAFCVCPLGKEYPVAPARAGSTMVNSGSFTQGRGTQHSIFKN